MITFFFSLVVLGQYAPQYSNPQYQYGAPPYQQPAYGAPQIPYETLFANQLCKNRKLSHMGELAVPDIQVLANPTNSILGCAQAVMYAQRTSQCGDTFFANTNQCACLRPGVLCKPDGSTTGFNVYRLRTQIPTVPVVPRLSSIHVQCSALEQNECSLLDACLWHDEDSECKKLECEELAENECVAPHCNWDVDSCKDIELASTKYGTSPYVGSPAVGAYNPAMPGMPLTPYRVNMDCEIDISDITRQPTIFDMAPSATVQQCMQQAQQQQMAGICGDKFVFGSAGECSCVRVNELCDEEGRPGWNVYTLGGGAYPPTGVPPAQPAYPATPGARPPATGYPATPGYTPGVPTTPGYPATGAYPGAYPQQPGYPAATGAYGAPGYGGRPASQYPPVAGAYPAAGAYPQQPGVFRPHTLKSTHCGSLDANTCEATSFCQWQNESCEVLLESAEQSEQSLANTRKLLVFGVIPLSIIVVIAGFLFAIYSACSHPIKTEATEPILMENSVPERIV